MKLLFSAPALIVVFCSSLSAAPALENRVFSDNFAINTVDTRCNLSIGSEVIDYGVQTRWALKNASTGGGRLTPGKRSLMLTIICPYPQPMRFVLHGDHTADGNLRYGANGRLHITVQDARVDDVNAQMASTTQSGILTGAQQSIVMLKSDEIYSATVNGELVNGKVFHAKIDIEPEINENDARVTSFQINESNFTLALIDP